MITLSEPRRLSAYEEGVGDLRELINQDGILIALIGKVHLALPANMEHSLRPLVGQKVAILRTDLPHREYIFRVLSQEVEPSK